MISSAVCGYFYSCYFYSISQDETGKPHLKITQRLRLDQTKLEDVSKRISSSSSHAILLALALSSSAVSLTDTPDILSRPLRWGPYHSLFPPPFPSASETSIYSLLIFPLLAMFYAPLLIVLCSFVPIYFYPLRNRCIEVL